MLVAIDNSTMSRLKNLGRNQILVNEENNGPFMMAIGGGLLTFVLGMFLMGDPLPFIPGGSSGIIAFGAVLGFLTFLAIGDGLLSMLREASSKSRR